VAADDQRNTIVEDKSVNSLDTETNHDLLRDEIAIIQPEAAQVQINLPNDVKWAHKTEEFKMKKNITRKDSKLAINKKTRSVHIGRLDTDDKKAFDKLQEKTQKEIEMLVRKKTAIEKQLLRDPEELAEKKAKR